MEVRDSVSSLNYDIIDTDFAMLNVKYGSINSEMQEMNKTILQGAQTIAESFSKLCDTGIIIKPKKNNKAKKKKEKD